MAAYQKFTCDCDQRTLFDFCDFAVWKQYVIVHGNIQNCNNLIKKPIWMEILNYYDYNLRI